MASLRTIYCFPDVLRLTNSNNLQNISDSRGKSKQRLATSMLGHFSPKLHLRKEKLHQCQRIDTKSKKH